jgi:hypothetical protein
LSLSANKNLPALALPSPFKMTGFPFGALPGSSSKSPKGTNPFSSPSPAHNPFVTIVDNKDVLWKSIATGDRSGGGQNSSGFGADKDASEYINRDGDEDSPVNDNVEYDPDIAYQKIVSLPENVPVLTGEESEECAFQVRAKLFRLTGPAEKKQSEKQSSSVAREGGEAGSNAAESSLPDSASSPGGGSGCSAGMGQGGSAEGLEWVEVGVGPLKLLLLSKPNPSLRNDQQQSDGKTSELDRANIKEDSNNEGRSSVDHVDGAASNRNNSSSIVAAARLVMRREDKKGGSGT